MKKNRVKSEITVTRDGYETGADISGALDKASLDLGLSLEAYAEYLSDVVVALKERASQVREEAGS